MADEYNVFSKLPDGTLSGPLMLSNVCELLAYFWARKYTEKYVGKEYPNGKGSYPWVSFEAMKVKS